MHYKYYSSNIIGCNNFLPSNIKEFIKVDLLNNKFRFKKSLWGKGNISLENKKNSHVSYNCGGKDFWITRKDEQEIEAPSIKILGDWFFQQGLLNYVKYSSNVFNLLDRKFNWSIHIVSYNNGGYYNWHSDLGSSILGDQNLFTFNYIIQSSSILKGGDMLYQEDKNKIIKINNQDNFMCVFPSYVQHAITPISSIDSKEVSFLDQRFSIQYWCSLE
tara:strand:+ start:865 stop:1515 length:651 start_codon:yes stop_codon:yes gene_type:complete